jgi:hypothetical protein
MLIYSHVNGAFSPIYAFALTRGILKQLLRIG